MVVEFVDVIDVFYDVLLFIVSRCVDVIVCVV